jgi:NadR type nicotinamide-nucleotide adenylyltransferase
MSGVARIAVYGPESTGKTRLAERLAGHFAAAWVPEYAREFWDVHGGIGLEDMLPIAREQWRREDAAAAHAERLLVCDTEALTTMLWSDVLYGTCPDEVRREAERRCRRYALYLLLDTDVPFASDPQRCFPDEAGRQVCLRVWRGALESRGLPFVTIRGGWEERERQAIAAVEAFLRKPAG